jgi:hypothetical protein
LFLGADQLAQYKGEMEVVERLMLEGSHAAVARLFIQLDKNNEKSPARYRQDTSTTSESLMRQHSMFESTFLQKYFDQKLSDLLSERDDGWFEEISSARTNRQISAAIQKHHEQIDLHLRMGAESMVRMAREKSFVESTIKAKEALMFKALATAMTVVVSVLNWFTVAYHQDDSQ